MDLPQPLIKGRLLKRYNRFLCDVALESGETITAHCPNPGAMLGLKDPGLTVWLSESANPKRKLKHTLELVEADATLVGIHTGRPNALAEEAILAGTIPKLAGYGSLRREVKYSVNSRVDLLLEDGPDPRPCYVEVKNVHLRRTGSLAEFPDSVTARGAKHLADLSEMVAQGNRAVMLFVIQRADCTDMCLAEDIDPAYVRAFEAADAAGVEVLAYRCAVQTGAIVADTAIPFSIHDPAGRT